VRVGAAACRRGVRAREVGALTAGWLRGWLWSVASLGISRGLVAAIVVILVFAHLGDDVL
jgi:hypothetical protein